MAASLDDIWRATALGAAPHDVEVSSSDRVVGYRDPAKASDHEIRVLPLMPTRLRMAWSFALLLATIAVVAVLVPSSVLGSTFGFRPFFLGGVFVLGMMVFSLVVHAVHRLFHRRRAPRLVRRQTHWIVDGKHRGDIEHAKIDLRPDSGEHVVDLLHHIGLTTTRHELYRSADERAARLAAELFANALG